MPHVQIKLKKVNGSTHLPSFDGQPSWKDLSSKITELFNIPSDRVGVAVINETKELEILTGEQPLQRFYEFFDSYEEPIKFVVQDMQTLDTATTIASNLLMDSNLSRSDDKIKLFCWVLNMFPSLFSVDIKLDKTVNDLKEAIKKKSEPTFNGFAYDTLNLWKLSPPIPSSEVEKKLRHAQTVEEIADCVELNPLDKLSKQFSSPPLEHVHIIVQPPHNWGRLNEFEFDGFPGPTEDTEVRQLRLLCKRYWNRGDEGRAEIYKSGTVQVPFMPRPRAGEAATTSDGMVIDVEYLATDVQEVEDAATTPEGMVIDAEYLVTGAQDAIKTTPASSGGEGSNKVLNERSDLDGMTNCTISYESLSLGPDFHDFFCKGYFSILVREEYHDMFQHISDLHEKHTCGVVVTGMPGIGKSMFLYFVLIERILNGQPTAYQRTSNRVILMLDRQDVRIFPNNVYLDPRGFPGTWALVDSNAELKRPRGEFMDTHSKFYLVQAASPQPKRWKSWKKQLSGAMAVMKPWSWEELYIGGTTFLSPPLDALTLRNIYVKYGGSARHCYALARGDVAEWEEQIPHLLAGMPDISIFERYIAGDIHHTAGGLLSFELITVIPNQTRQPLITLVSQHIAEHFFRAVFVKNSEMFWNYFNQFSSVPETRTSADWLWELYAMLVVLSIRAKMTSISLCHLSPIESPQPPTPIELPFSDVIVHGDQKALGEELSRVIPSLSPTKSILFRPGAKDQATFDAFSISGDKQVTLYQTTIPKSHSIKAKALDFVLDALKLAEEQGTSGVKNLLPSPTRKWRLVFLIPEECKMDWNIGQNIDFGGIKRKHQWDRYVEQFVGVLQKGTAASYQN